ncbi:MAG: fatty-acyl-CoA synthase [Parasphingorhabdus sp.]|jgi:fatty-acyl-CoA synthase
MTSNLFSDGLEKTPANYTPLTPLSFLARTARTYPEHISVVHGERQFCWRETFERCIRLASALKNAGVSPGDTVAIIAPNVPAIFEVHFGVPMAGAVLNTINTRLDADTIAFILEHGEAKVLMVDTELTPTVKQALAKVSAKLLVIDIADAEVTNGEHIGDIEYEDFIASGDNSFDWSMPTDEWDAISLNYTSGTTGKPKGVVYHHRGAYLNAMSNAVGWNMGHHPVYLWTLPMFHCNGWCFPWTLAAIAGTSICQRRVEAGAIFNAIADQGVSHFCGAPIVLNILINAADSQRRDFNHQVNVMTAAAPPPASVLAEMEQQGFSMTHVYGLTETYGPAVMCAWHDNWSDLPPDQRAAQKSRQGVPYHVLEGLEIKSSENMQDMPADGATMGEAMFRGNIVMKGYLKNAEATEKAFAGGWFHSGDLGVMHPDRYIQLKDRSKDIIISGGENISSIEVEDTLYKHPSVLEAAVVARPDDKWGETPCAFVTLKGSSEQVSDQDIINFCRDNMAHFKCPRTVVFGELPKTSTGKVQKFKLRVQTEQLGSLN